VIASASVGAPSFGRLELLGPGNTKVDNSAVETVVKMNGGVATLFVKNGDQYQRAATTVKKEDGTSAVGTALDANSPAVAKLNNGRRTTETRLFSARPMTLDMSRSRMPPVQSSELTLSAMRSDVLAKPGIATNQGASASVLALFTCSRMQPVAC
jgi:Cache 3/Cache 2 fusion domain